MEERPMPEAVISLSTIRGVKKYALADSLWEVEDMLGTKGALEPRASLPLSSAPKSLGRYITRRTLDIGMHNHSGNEGSLKLILLVYLLL